MPPRNRAASVSVKLSESAVTVLATANPAIADSSKCRRGQPIVALVSGIAATIAPIAKTVTLCPAVLSLTPRSRLIPGSTPAGIVSVRSVMNAVVAKARRPASGSRASVVAGAGRVFDCVMAL